MLHAGAFFHEVYARRSNMSVADAGQDNTTRCRATKNTCHHVGNLIQYKRSRKKQSRSCNAASYLGVKDFHRMETPRHFHQRGVQEVALKLLSFQGGTHDYQLHVWSLLQHLPTKLGRLSWQTCHGCLCAYDDTGQATAAAGAWQLCFSVVKVQKHKNSTSFGPAVSYGDIPL